MAVPTVAIAGSLVTPDGATPVTGVIQCKLSQPGTAVDGGEAVRVIPYATGSVTNGAVSLSLVPNDAITPTGTFYQVSFSVTLASGRNVAWTENWQLASTPTSIDIGSVPRIDGITGTVTDTSTLRAEIAQSLSVAQGYANDAVTGALAGTGAVPQTWAFTGDGTTTQFTLTGATHAAAAMYVVALSGVVQAPITDYTVDLGTGKIVFVTAPANGVPIAVRSMGYARAISEGDTLLVTATGSTTARKEADRWADVVNVKDFGARGDGVTDDTAAVAAAYAALGSKGGALGFPPGDYRFNLTVAKASVSIIGSGRGATGEIGTYIGGAAGNTVFRPVDLTKPVLQVGDGTAKVNSIALRHFSMLGDGSTATSDGLVIVGASKVATFDVAIHGFGGDGLRSTSSATQPSFWNMFSDFHVSGCGKNGVNLIYGPGWLTSHYIDRASIWAGSGASSRAIRLEGVVLYTSNLWVEASASNKGVLMTYSGGTVAPGWFGGGTTALDSTSSADNLLEIDNTTTASPGRKTVAVFLKGVSVDGRALWTADSSTTDLAASVAFAGALDRSQNAYVIGELGFAPLMAGAGQEPASPVTRLRAGGSAGAEYLELVASGLLFPGTAALPLRFTGSDGSGTNDGRVWRTGSFNQLRFKGNGAPANDYDGVPISPQRHAPTYGASVAIQAERATIFVITATNGTAFTIANPSSPVTDQRITIQVRNTSGGALGAVTWDTAYKLAAWTSPATGFSRAIDFIYDGTNWIEVARTPADVPN